MFKYKFWSLRDYAKAMNDSPCLHWTFIPRIVVRYVAKSRILQVFFRYPKVLGDVVDIISLIVFLFLSEDIFGILPALFLLLLIPSSPYCLYSFIQLYTFLQLTSRFLAIVLYGNPSSFCFIADALLYSSLFLVSLIKSYSSAFLTLDNSRCSAFTYTIVNR